MNDAKASIGQLRERPRSVQHWTWAALTALSLASTSACAQVRPEDEPAWVASVAAGWAGGPSSIPLSIGLGGTPGVRLEGRAALGSGMGYAVSVARQFRGRDESDDSGERPRPWRLELEGLHATLKREGLTAGVVNVTTDDRLNVDALFLNGLVRLGRSENTTWWLGLGMGRARVAVADASSRLPGCACLSAGEADANVGRVKLRIEGMAGSDSGWFAEAAHTRLPSIEAGSKPGPVTTYGSMSLNTLMIGWRLRF